VCAEGSEEENLVSAGVRGAGLACSHGRGFTGTREGSRSESVQNADDGGIRRQNSNRYDQQHCEKEYKST
jgi:hypothetical protein